MSVNNKAGHSYDESRARLERVEKQSRSIVHDSFGNQALIKADGENATVIDITEPVETNEYVGPFDMVEEDYASRTFYEESRLWSFDGILSIPINPIKTMRVKGKKKWLTLSFSKDYQNDHTLGPRTPDPTQALSPKATFKQIGATFRAGIDVAICRWAFFFSTKNVSAIKFKALRGWAALPIVTFLINHLTRSSNIRLPAFRLTKSQTAFVQEADGVYPLNKGVIGPRKKLFVKKPAYGISPVVSITTADPFGMVSSVPPKVGKLLDVPSMYRPDAFGMPQGFFYGGALYADESKAEKIWQSPSGVASPAGLVEANTCYTHRVYSFGPSTWDGTNPFPMTVDVSSLTANYTTFWSGFGIVSDGSMVFRLGNKALFQNGTVNHFGQKVEINQHLYKRADRSVYRVTFKLVPYTHTGGKNGPRTFTIKVYRNRFDDWLEVEAEQGVGATGGIGDEIGSLSVTMVQGVTTPMLRATSSMDGKLCRLEIIAFDDLREWIDEYDGKDHRLVLTKKVIEFSFSDGDDVSKVNYSTSELTDVWQDFAVNNVSVGRPDFNESVVVNSVRSDEASSVTVYSLGSVPTDSDWYTVTADWKVTDTYRYTNSKPYGLIGGSIGEKKKLHAYSPTETGFLEHNLTANIPSPAQLSYSHSIDGWSTHHFEGLFSVPHGASPPVVVWDTPPYTRPNVIPNTGLGGGTNTVASYREEVFETSAPAISIPLGISAYDQMTCNTSVSAWTATERYVDNVKVQDDLLGGVSTTTITCNGQTIRTIVRDKTGVLSDSNGNYDVFWDGTQNVPIYVPTGIPDGVYCTPWNAGFGSRAQTGYLYQTSKILLESTSHGLLKDRIQTTVRRIRNPRTGAVSTTTMSNLSLFV